MKKGALGALVLEATTKAQVLTPNSRSRSLR